MKQQSNEKIIKSNDLYDKAIYIIGPNGFQNDLISYYIYKECGVKCISNITIDYIQKLEDGKNNTKILILIDSRESFIENILVSPKSNTNDITSRFLVAIFNLKYKY